MASLSLRLGSRHCSRAPSSNSTIRFPFSTLADMRFDAIRRLPRPRRPFAALDLISLGPSILKTRRSTSSSVSPNFPRSAMAIHTASEISILRIVHLLKHHPLPTKYPLLHYALVL